MIQTETATEIVKMAFKAVAEFVFKVNNRCRCVHDCEILLVQRLTHIIMTQFSLSKLL